MDLSTNYMGLKLKNPVVPSASPLSKNVDNIKRMEDAGAAAVVMFSMFEEELNHEAQEVYYFETMANESNPEALSYMPKFEGHQVRSGQYLDCIHKAIQEVEIPVIGSLNGVTNQGWVDYAKKIQEAGASALELNMFYIPTDLSIPGAEVECKYVEMVEAVREVVTIPIALKISPYFSSIANMATRFKDAGANALVLFNRFYQPDFDLEELKVVPNLTFSNPSEIRLPLLWIALLHGRLKISLAATTGVHSVNEVLKYIMAGADVTMTTSALLKKGIDVISTLLKDLETWMAEHDYDSVWQMKGSMSQESVADPDTFERVNYIKVLESYENPYSA